MSIKERFTAHIHELQDHICKGLEDMDGKATFHEDKWERNGGGGGRTRVISNGNVFEKGGVNISVVHGELPEAFKQKFNVKEAQFFACGLSLVIHPLSPMVPTVHANWRYFEMYNPDGSIHTSWFGGGTDLTPYYLVEEDAKSFHQVLKDMCDLHHPEYYSRFKEQCDAYFNNTHRGERRGIGGIFYDYLKGDQELDMNALLDFSIDAGKSFLDSYLPIVERNKHIKYTEAQKYWQEIRRGRYVEFNLLHDRGTHFGIKTKGRTESILMSLPPTVRWDYDAKAAEGSEEAKLIKVLQEPVDWV